MSALNQQSAFYSYINRAAPMQFFAQQQSYKLSWPLYPLYFSSLPVTIPMPYTSPTNPFSLSNPLPNYLLQEESKNVEVQSANNSSHSGSVTPESQMNDSVENPKPIEKRGSTRSKNFECQTCHKRFGYKHVLQNHEKVHTGEKSYRCLKCNKCFRRDHHLKVHMRLHSGEKPFTCSFPMCDRQFVQVANQRRHLKTHNPINRLKVHEKLLASNDSRPIYSSESSEEPLRLRKSPAHCVKRNDFSSPSSFDANFTSSSKLRFESPEQSEPEDLSVKTLTRIGEKRD